MTQVRVELPRTIGAAAKALARLDRLATATNWERAAVVAAFVEPGARGGNPNAKPRLGRETINEFARRGIVGLRSASTVRHYHDAWMAAVGERPEPGDVVRLPDAEFPTMPGKTTDQRDHQGLKQKVRNDPDAVAAEITQAPKETQARIFRQVMDHHRATQDRQTGADRLTPADRKAQRVAIDEEFAPLKQAAEAIAISGDDIADHLFKAAELLRRATVLGGDDLAVIDRAHDEYVLARTEIQLREGA